MHHAPDDAPDNQPAKRTDWKAVERDYLTGKYTSRELAAMHGCSHTQVSRRAKLGGWLRMAPGKPQAAPRAPAPAPAPTATSSTSAQLLARPGALDPTRPEKPLGAVEEAFLTEYMRNGLNGTAAWMFTHPGCNADTAAVAASIAIRRPRIAARLAAERQRMAAQHEMSRDQLLGEFLAIVRADPNELMQMRAVACSDCWPKDPGSRKGRWVDPDPECGTCMGEGNSVPWFNDTRKLSPDARALFAGVKLTKDGATILTHDKMAALVNIGKILGAYEKDNKQKQPELTEALTQFVGQLHADGAGRLKFTPRAPGPTQPKVQH